MSELKGQMLGMVLTLAAFGAIAGALIPTFQETAKSAGKQVESVATNGSVVYNLKAPASFAL